VGGKTMRIKEINLYTISMPLKTPFYTHLQNISDRESIIVEIIDGDGVKGYGEAVAFSSPWYTEETIKTCFHMLVDFLIPILKKSGIQHPEEAYSLFTPVKRNHMAKASLETALWDLYAKQKEVALASLLSEGKSQSRIPAGAVVGAQSITEALQQIEQFISEGYKRVKVKINPRNDYAFLSEVRKHFPTVSLLADANSAYTLNDLNQLKALDDFDLTMIEQPLGHDDIREHAKLQKELQTPICLDESIHSLEDVKSAIEFNSCQIINIKISRVGGLKVAKDIYELCLANDMKVWVGGMIEFGISRAHNIAFGSLPGFSIPGDISASSRYWENDVVIPEIKVDKGFIEVPTTPGIGFTINQKRIEKVLLSKNTFTF
jgi:o-succinylbenzoate synthase